MNKIKPISSERTKKNVNNESCAEESSISTEHAQALKRLKERREREPLLYCKVVTKWPLQTFLITLSAHTLMIFISIILAVSGYDILPVDFQNLPLEVNDQPWRPRDLAWTYRDEHESFYDRTPVSGYRESSYSRARLQLFYDGKGNNIFTKEILQEIQSIENSLTALNEYQTNYCRLDLTLNICQFPLSVIRYFDGSLASVSPVFYDPNFDNIAGVLNEANTNNATNVLFQFYLGKSSVINSTFAFNSITRSVISFGYPLAGYDTEEAYTKVITEYTQSHMVPILSHIRNSYNIFDFSFRSDLLWINEVSQQAKKDALFTIGSVCFIFTLILLHTKSLWITSFAIFSIISCFVITNLIYRVLFDFRYIGFFHILIVFIVLGIGADDVFVFYDVWRNAASRSYPSLAHRLSDCYRKSALSMLFTSFTTAVAFFASAIAPILATRSFGIFSGVVVIINYISVIVYFPTVVIVYHIKFEKFKWPCIENCKQKCRQHLARFKIVGDGVAIEQKNAKSDNHEIDITGNSETPPKVQYTNHQRNQPIGLDKIINDRNKQSLKAEIDGHTQQNYKSAHVVSNDISEADILDNGYEVTKDVEHLHAGSEKRTVKKRKKKSFMVRFFRDKYSKFVTHKIIRWVILAVMAGVIVFFAVQASKLEPDNEGVKFLKDSHVYRIAEQLFQEAFLLSSADRTINVNIVWGMHQNDMSGCHFSSLNCRGNPVWDSTFDPSTPEAQTAVKDLCNTMFGWSSETAAEYGVRTDISTGQYDINCYMLNLDTFLQEETAITGSNWDLTYDYTKTLSFMNNRTTFYNTTGFTPAYTHYLEVPISYWLSNRYTYNYTDDFDSFNPLVGEKTGTFSTSLNTDSTKVYGNDLLYVGIEVHTTVKWKTLGYSEGIPLMRKWEDFVNSEMTKMPEGMKNGFQTSELIWHWLIVSEMLANNAVYGIIIGVSLALPILIIATRNVITGCLATLSMCCSTVCVIGVIPLGGWKLGLLESLNMCMVVGLTVDYVVHLAEGYTLSLHKDRFSRVCDMLDEMAVSVFFGACTTLGASMFMFLTQLTFFFQFGIFMFSTIGFSLFFSMGMFVTVMGLCGPQGDTGDVVVLYKKIRTKFRKDSVESVIAITVQSAPKSQITITTSEMSEDNRIQSKV